MTDRSTDNRTFIFAEIVHLLKSTHQYERIFHLIVYRIARLFHCQACVIVLIHPQSEYLKIENCFGLSLTFCKAFRKKITTGPLGELIWTGQPILIMDSELHPEQAAEIQLEYPFRSCVGIQIATNHRTLGYLYADSTEPGAFTEDDVPFLQALADLAGIAYHKYQLGEDVLRLERIDHETGLEKYPAFLEKMKSTMDRARTFEEPFSVVLLDVDNFKHISNTYGSETSQHLLQQIAGIVGTQTAHSHPAGRYGIDEFIILLDKCTLSEAIEYASNLRTTIEATTFTSKGLRSTVSIGVSSFPQNAETLEDLIVTAKNALFEAQRSGKNTVRYFEKEWYAKDPAPGHR